LLNLPEYTRSCKRPAELKAKVEQRVRQKIAKPFDLDAMDLEKTVRKGG